MSPTIESLSVGGVEVRERRGGLLDYSITAIGRRHEYLFPIFGHYGVNGLAPTDSTSLEDMKPIYLVPVGPGVD